LAGVVPERTIDKLGIGRAGERAWAWPRLRAARWLPPALLALATVLAIVMAYVDRPFVTVDVGDYLDTPYLPNLADRAPADFFAREVGITGPEQTSAWPADRPTLELAGQRPGLWQLTVQAADGLPDNALSGVTVSVNDVRLWVPRGAPRGFVAIVPPELAAAATWRLRIEPAVVGEPIPSSARPGAVTLAPARTYRWTTGQSTIRLPGLGRGDWMVGITAVAAHPDGQPLDATVAANGVPIGRLPQGDSSRRTLSLFVPASLVPDGDLTLTVSSNTAAIAGGDRRALGILLYEVAVAPVGGRSLLPPLKFLLYALTIALCLYWCLLRMTRRAWLAALLALLIVLGGAWALAAARFPTAFMLPRLALLALWSVALLLALERLIAWAFRAAGVPLGDRALRALLLIFFAGYWLKAGGMLYPYFVGIDMQLQMTWVRQIFGGEFWTFYGTGNPMNDRTMPTAEWGANKPIIPYSPWFHIFAGVFLLAPFSAVLAGHMFSALVDCSRVFLIAILARKTGCSERESLFAGLLYAVLPVTFLLHSWGNLPTTFGIWWTLLSTVFVVVAFRRLDRPWPFITLTLMLTATMLIYTVMAAFMMLFLALLVPALWLTTRTKNQEPRTEHRKPRQEKRSLAAIALAALAALGLVTLIYYGQYIPLLLERTLPYFLGGSDGQKAGVQEHQPFLAYLAEFWPRFGYFARPVMYGIQLPLLLAVAGLAGLYVAGRGAAQRRRLVVLLCWAAVAALFMIAGSRVAMVDKQVFYFVPALALLAGPLLSRLWARGLPARLVVASIYLFTLAAALDFWVFRIVTTRQ
jgi:hypothetical protein